MTHLYRELRSVSPAGETCLVHRTLRACDLGTLIQRAEKAGKSLRNLDLHRASLRGARLDGVGLRKVILSHADLQEARLEACSLPDATLQAANLSGSVFRRCNLGGVKLSHAVLYGTVFDGCQMQNMVLRRTRVQNVSFHDCDGVIDGGADYRGYRFFAVRHDHDTFIAAGCRWFSSREAKAHWFSPGYRRARGPMGALTKARVKLLLQQAEALGWPVKALA